MKILAIDGNSILNRAFYGIKGLANSKGFPTNAITGFINIYLKEMAIVNPDFVVVAFDLKAPTFRHKMADSYKANRKGMPDDLRQQLPVIKELLTAMGVKILEVEGFEADDVLGTISRIFSENNGECFLLTGDRDSLQLINSHVTVRLATNRETVVYDTEKVHEVYGIEPKQLIEIKGLMGDSSDNISGVQGIGEKTALNLIKEFGSIANLYENLGEAKLTNSVRTKLENGYDSAILSRTLGTIVLDAPIDENAESYSVKPADDAKIREILTELEMFKILEKLSDSLNMGEKAPQNDVALEPIKTLPLDSQIISGFSDDEVCFIFQSKGEISLQIFHNETVYTTVEKSLAIEFLTSGCKKITFNAKPAYLFSFENNFDLKNIVFCCDLAGYLLNSMSSEYSVQNLCSSYQVSFRSDMGDLSDISSLYELYLKLKSEIEETEMTSLLYDVEQPLCEVLASMEHIGVQVNTDGVKEFGEKLTSDIKRIEGEIHEFAGESFNISSPKQLGTILFEKLGLPSKKRTKTGYSTNADVLESLMDKHPIIPLVVEYRTLTKLNSTYVEGLLKEVKADGRVHSIFKQTETRTGRISSTEPNMQNIPVRKELGRNMRKFFVSRDGDTLLDADYSQIELRVLAHVCDDEHMKEAFLTDTDIHTRTASQVFGLPEDFVTPQMRSAAKAVNFGIIYGIGPFSLSQDIGVTVAEAKKYIAQYLDNFKNVGKFMDETVEGGIRDGYVTTIFGRRRYIPELSSSNKIMQAFGKRAAMNAPIQGAAADIIKIAMVKVYKRLKVEKLNARLILQVHDELIVESSAQDKDKAAKILHEEMIGAASLSVPLTADVNEGLSWYDAKG